MPHAFSTDRPSPRRFRFVAALLAAVLVPGGCTPPALQRSAGPSGAFDVLALYTAAHDPAHIDFVREAHTWFAEAAAREGFTYTATSDWSRLHADTLAAYELVVFLDSRPEAPAQRRAFEAYMEGGGAWLGFHFAAFALTPSAYPQDWDWYHDTFLGSGAYDGNTWRPTSAVLHVEHPTHPVTRGLPETFVAAPNEWYRWQHDLRANPDVDILLAIDPSSFPLGTGPKPHEIWRDGYYPVVWTNRNYRMVYVNMGHNDMDYEGGTDAPLSSTFSSDAQNELLLRCVRWLGRGRRASPRRGDAG